MPANRAWCLVALLFCVPAAGTAQQPASAGPPREQATDSVRWDRLAALGRLWATIGYFHPYLASRAIDWDSALTAAIPAVERAPDREGYAAAVEGMLEALHDPATHMVSPQTAAESPASPEPSGAWGPDSVWIVTLHYAATLDNFDGAIARLQGDGEGGERTPPLPVVLVVNRFSILPAEALALLESGQARLVSEGEVGDAGAVATLTVGLSDGLRAQMRLTELIHVDGSVGLAADSVVPPGSPDSSVMAAALALIRRSRVHSGGVRSEAVPRVRREAGDSASPFPERELRLLAAFRMWGVERYFYPYRELTGEDWDRVLREFLPRFDAAGDSLEYALTVAEMWAHIHDSHGFIDSPTLDAHLSPPGRPPVQLRMIEGRPTVTRLTDDSAAKASGIRLGDEVLTVDGESALLRLNRLRRFRSASTLQASVRDGLWRLLRGPDSSTIRVTVRGGDGHVRRLTLPRLQRYAATDERTGPLLELLPGNIGYADLDRLPGDSVDAMFTRFRRTRAIIFDMRGYPHGTAWSIAPRLTDRPNVPAARFYRPTPMGRDTTEITTAVFVQTLPPAKGERYRGRTVMLIDERTQSQAEHTGLFLKAANGTTFVGSPTAGANGDVTNFTIPGGLTLWFSGQGVEYPDGHRLQRLGLVPDIPATPTLRGIREGHDEVLERALDWLRTTVPRSRP